MAGKFTVASIWPSQTVGRVIPKESGHIKIHCSALRILCRKRKLTKNLRYPRRPKLPPHFGLNRFLMNDKLIFDSITDGIPTEEDNNEGLPEKVEAEQVDGWETEEIETISLLFQGRIPQKPFSILRERPLPLPTPHKLRPIGLPTSKSRIQCTAKHLFSSRVSVSNRIYKDPSFLINLAKQIKDLSPGDDVSSVLDQCSRFLRKGSLSLTIRELGHMGLPERALHVFSWIQTQNHLYPDDRVLAAVVEVLAKSNVLKVSSHLEEFTIMASRNVIEAMATGFIKGGRLKLAWKLLALAKHHGRVIRAGIYVKLILELVKNPDKYLLADALLEELAKMDNLNLNQQDCTSLMTSCVKLKKFVLVEHLFSWFKQSGKLPSVVMYTTIVHSRYSEQRYREGLAVVWEMESSNCLFDLPAYRVVIKLLVAMHDVPRAARYFSKLKEAGFSPTYDLYCDMMALYMHSERLAKCEEIREEALLAGFD